MRGALLFAALAAGTCDLLPKDDRATPSDAEAATYFTGESVREVELRGNVVQVAVTQPVRQLERGGALWARVAPYVYVFSPGTRDLFEDWPGVAAVRVITYGPGDREVARAMLRRDELSEILWRRSLNILGHALREGTQRPRLLEELVQWGEEHTEYEYSRAYVP